MDNYYSDMIPTLADRASTSALSSFGFSNKALRTYLESYFNRPLGKEGCFIGDPTFEAVFGWEPGSKKIKELGGDLLRKELVKALDRGELKKEYYPYTHQERAWNILDKEDPQSVIISSGTGSGKTECFMVPILNRLLDERARRQKPLVGVRSLFLYPLNALINSQRERLRTWTEPFGGDIRFCLYNGLTEEKVKASRRHRYPNEVIDRKSLRNSPPPILVTNPTMLEYMLVRAKDNPILEQSNGLLDTIVLDEAHTYIGSQAAEMTLLIRRVLQAFGKKPSEVRFIATSATIGEEGEEARSQLKSFLTQIAGVDESKVHVVEGKREIPQLQNFQLGESSLESLKTIENPEELYKRLTKHSTARKIRGLFVRNSDAIAKLSDICSVIYEQSENYSSEQQQKALEWLDLLSRAESNEESFLPLRAHIFQKTVAGLWACADQCCSQVQGTSLEGNEWPFGMVYLDNRTECDCGAPVYEVVSCTECGEVYLNIEVKEVNTGGELSAKIIQPAKDEGYDEFELELEDDPEAINPEENESINRHGNTAIITNRDLEGTGTVYLNKNTRIVEEGTDGLRLSIREYEGEENGLPCPSCLDGSYKRHNRFRAHRIGAPSLLNVLLPTLLNYAEEKNESPENPFNGRRLLTFNDSRQGTARIAAKLQQNAEITKARGLIYHYVLQEGGKKNKAKVKKLKNKINRLTEANNGDLDDIIEDEKKELKKLKGFNPVEYSTLKKLLANENGDFSYICNNYKRHDPHIFSSSKAGSLVSELLVVREFARRPRRQNNLETLGLIGLEYPKINEIREAPDKWLGNGYSLEEWKTYLKLCVDYFVRAGGSLGSTKILDNWLGLPFYRSHLLGPDEEDVGKYQRRWPNTRRGKARSRIVRLLIYLLGVDVESPKGEDIVDDLLYRGWKDLIDTSTLENRDNGFVLPLDNISFTIPTKAWICPITRRFLDKTIGKVTPYLPKYFEGDIKCEEVELPRYDKPFGNTQNPFKNRDIAQKWLNDQETINKLRERGLWSIFNDRVIEMMPYYSTAEHSAQQDSYLLKKYEKGFKEGKINILSCSTTMEMGIDIGGIRIVAMNNVPPHPANYLQRAGRAGRRNELRSTTVTLCKPNPHDLAAFENSSWAFDTQLPAPTVSLNSQVIVQRHVNAYLLSHFLNNVQGLKDVDKYKLTSGWFFTNEESTYRKFINWCENQQLEEDKNVFREIKILVRGSVFDETDPIFLIKNSANNIDQIAVKWRNEYETITKQREDILENGGKDQPAVKAIDHQLRRLTDEYLLRELASKGFLPGYGFPSNITVFDHYNIAAFKQEKNKKSKTRDDNTLQNRELPSRDIVSALREYAPGADIVVDGVVYKSAGITLNWHIPSNVSEVKESQAIKYAWRCHSCGASGSTFNRKGALLCDHCGEQIRPSNIEEYLEPSGFSVDFYESRKNDVTSRKFIPVERPWVEVGGEWSPLINPSLGRYRSTSEGQIFHHSKGENGTGYAICMMCGRAEPLDNEGNLPKKFESGKQHNKLRGKKGDRVCPGSANEWAIKENISLGHQQSTDILEIQLKDSEGNWLKDRNKAATLAVVFRDSIADLLGVQSMELICDVKEASIDGIRSTYSILVYDRNASGFSSNIDHIISNIFQKAYEKLNCSNNCSSSCPKCVLDYDQRFRFDELDRFEALSLLNEEWLNKHQLPKELDYFDEISNIEHEDIEKALIREVNNNPSGTVYLFADGDSEDCDIAVSPLRNMAIHLSEKPIEVKVAFPQNLFEDLGDEDLLSLLGMMDRDYLEVIGINKLPKQNNVPIIAAIKFSSDILAWVTQDKSAFKANKSWSSSERDKNPLISGNLKDWSLNYELKERKGLRQKLKGKSDLELELKNDLDGTLKDFGNKFWEIITNNHSKTKSLFSVGGKNISEVSYSDRYLHNPLSIAMVRSLFSGLKEIQSKVDTWDQIPLTINTTKKNKGYNNYGNLIFHDWEESKYRDYVLKNVFDKDGFNISLNVLRRKQIKHGRIIEIIFKDDSVLFVRLDQGVGYWKVENPRYSNNPQEAQFDFTHVNTGESGLKKEVDQVLKANPKIIGRNTPTQIFIKYRD
ncbi:DEAD/DEAH box helicase [Fodinibius halophilus]|uniref:DEAD/DEAH box helicase n=1 Tax=Fodinibius halophilus TaxID=1736908 RepID=A0A6M1THX0_9BACT|nr:DEAD/DEAH box helicase [Fodinibius halophilus]NGP89682.1 DEAD/DEAH box helicase [Fodinibius halophilus]